MRCDDTAVKPGGRVHRLADVRRPRAERVTVVPECPTRAAVASSSPGNPTLTDGVEQSGGVNILQLMCNFNPNTMSVDLKLPFGLGGISQDLPTTVSNTNSLGVRPVPHSGGWCQTSREALVAAWRSAPGLGMHSPGVQTRTNRPQADSRRWPRSPTPAQGCGQRTVIVHSFD